MKKIVTYFRGGCTFVTLCYVGSGVAKISKIPLRNLWTSPFEFGLNFQEEISKLLRYESSQLPPGEKVSIAEYCSRMRAGQRDIYYLAAPSRALAEGSAYYEGIQNYFLHFKY